MKIKCSDEGCLVTYGGMSKEPVVIPTSLFIFKRLTSTGFWLNKWNLTHSKDERVACIEELFDLVRAKKLKEPFYNTVSFSKSSDAHLLDHVMKWAASGKTIFVQ
jgi:trans-2-enoyl-CoA reductase